MFSPEEESRLLQQSHTEKTTANQNFASGDFSDAIQGYEKALAICPEYLEYDIAVLRSNIAACHLKLAEWKEAVATATQALESLGRLEAASPVELDKNTETDAGSGGLNAEIEDTAEVYLSALVRTGRSIHDVQKLRTKALLRRAKARHELGDWSSLQGSVDDYTVLSKAPHQLSDLDRKAVVAALEKLPIQLEAARNSEMADMMSKLKQVGNGILKPFGLSTDNFQFNKDENSGGYSMNFNQTPKRS